MKKVSKKTLITTLSVVLALALAIGGTLAYLQSVTGWFTNIFTFAPTQDNLQVSTIGAENDAASYKIVPGSEQELATRISLVNEDVDCWLFLAVKPGANAAEVFNYTIDSGWTRLQNAEGTDYVVPSDDAWSEWYGCDIYYRSVGAAANSDAQVFSVLAGNKVNYKSPLTYGDIKAMTDITLSFRAKAVEKAAFGNELKAWLGEELPKTSVTTLNTTTITPEGGSEVPLAKALTFTALDTDSNTYDNWTTTFELSFDKDVNGSEVGLYGSYASYQSGAWIGSTLNNVGKDSLAANETIDIMALLVSAMGGSSSVTFSDVQTIGTFNCGLAYSGSETDLHATLSLVLIDPNNPSNRVILSTNTYAIPTCTLP